MFEFAVIGNGMLGAPTARHLAESGKETLLIGSGEPSNYSSHRGVYSSHYDEGRICRVIDPDPIRAELSWLSVPAHKALQESTGIDFFVAQGLLAVGPTTDPGSEYIDSLIPANEKYQLGCTKLTRGNITDRFPYFEPGANFVGLLQENLAGYINPRSYIRAENAEFENRGGVIVSDLVTKLRASGNGLEIITQNDTYHTDKAVLATGAFSWYGELLTRQVNLRVGSHTVLLVELDADQARNFRGMPPIIHKPGDPKKHCFVLPPIEYPDGCCYLKIAQPTPRHYFDNIRDIQAWFKTDGDNQAREELIQIIGQLFPSLRARSYKTLPCVTTFTPSGHPYIDEAAKNIVVLIGGNGYVAKCSIALGNIAAAYAIDGSWTHNQIDRDIFRI